MAKITKLFDRHFAPIIRLKDGNIIRGTSEIISIFPKILDFMEGKFKDGMIIRRTDNNLEITIKEINLNITKNFIDIMNKTKQKGNFSLYQDYNNAIIYGYNREMRDVFNLNQMDINFAIEYGDVNVLFNTFFPTLSRKDIIDYVFHSLERSPTELCLMEQSPTEPCEVKCQYDQKLFTNFLNEFLGYILKKTHDISHLTQIAKYAKYITSYYKQQLREILDVFIDHLPEKYTIEQNYDFGVILKSLDIIGREFDIDVFDDRFFHYIKNVVNADITPYKLGSKTWILCFLTNDVLFNLKLKELFLETLDYVYKYISKGSLTDENVKKLSTYHYGRHWCGFYSCFEGTMEARLKFSIENKILTDESRTKIKHIILTIYNNYCTCDQAWINFLSNMCIDVKVKQWYKTHMFEDMKRILFSRKICDCNSRDHNRNYYVNIEKYSVFEKKNIIKKKE